MPLRSAWMPVSIFMASMVRSRSPTLTFCPTVTATEAMTQITTVIGRINDYQGIVAAAVDEQAATTEEMAQSVQRAAQSTGRISGSIAAVSAAANRTSDIAEQTRHAAGQLDAMSGRLDAEVARFRLA